VYNKAVVNILEINNVGIGLLLEHFLLYGYGEKCSGSRPSLYLYIIHLQNVDYSLIILFFILSLLIRVKLNKIIRKLS